MRTHDYRIDEYGNVVGGKSRSDLAYYRVFSLALRRRTPEVRRRSTDAELWRTAFARQDEMPFSTLVGFWAGVPAVAPASAGRRLEARGVEPLFPACYVQQRPRMLYQSHFRGEYVLMNKRGRRWMLLVLLLPWQAFGNLRKRDIGPLVSVIRTVGSAGSRRKKPTIRRR